MCFISLQEALKSVKTHQWQRHLALLLRKRERGETWCPPQVAAGEHSTYCLMPGLGPRCLSLRPTSRVTLLYCTCRTTWEAEGAGSWGTDSGSCGFYLWCFELVSYSVLISVHILFCEDGASPAQLMARNTTLHNQQFS